MISTSANKKFLFAFLVLVFVSGVSADYYYSGSNDHGITGGTADTGFSVPQYDSQEEILTQLVAPFIFVSILLQILFNRALRFAFVDEDSGDDLLSLVEDNRPNLNREATLMAITATAILIPTPFWNYVRLATASIGVVTVTLVAAAAFYLLYAFIRG